jgi:nitroimidazol reductase NimA-like FMN-containing flavoprotein (pyridoxamine 5'-phosphate oxidase superfamily)
MADLKKTERSKVKRLAQRGHYDEATAYAILDAGFIAHIAYVLDGRPVVMPTAYWREGNHVYWHGHAKSRMLLAFERGAEACFEVTHLDGLVVARSGFHKSVNYRSVILFGQPYKVADPAEKLAKMERFVERLYPGRWKSLRPVTRQELKATTVIGMEIREGSAKVRSGGPVDDAPDYKLPIWAGVIPIRQVLGKPVDDGRLARGTGKPPRVRL